MKLVVIVPHCHKKDTSYQIDICISHKFNIIEHIRYNRYTRYASTNNRKQNRVLSRQEIPIFKELSDQTYVRSCSKKVPRVSQNKTQSGSQSSHHEI